MNKLQEEYVNACNESTDINEHIPFLYQLAKECDSIVEFGVRTGKSTRAFLYSGTPLKSYDLELNSELEDLFFYTKQQGQDVDYIHANVLEINIEPVDLLFIDTWHVHDQLKQELKLHGNKANKYIVFHDTFTFGLVGEDGGMGLIPAIMEFLMENSHWHVKYFFTNNNGLTVLERIDDTKKKSSDSDEIDEQNKISPLKNENDFDWGIFQKNTWLINALAKEFSDEESNYEKFFKVEENDVVVDIGASVGPFTYSIINKNPKLVYCLEPHPELFNTLTFNLSKFNNVICINEGISSNNGDIIFENLFNDDLEDDYIGSQMWCKTQTCKGITFQTLLEKYNIDKIDFLKIDCEGGEYDVFTENNLNWIYNNVKKIAGEWHFHTQELRNKFIEFRNLYLNKFDNYKIFLIDRNSNFEDVTSQVYEDRFVYKYAWINIYIDNRQQEKWRQTPYPTLEITTSIPKKGCVVNCNFCPQNTLISKFDFNTTNKLGLNKFKLLLDKVPTDIRIVFSGFTEPWLNSETTDMVLHAYEKGHPIAVFTTGIGMNIEDIIKIKHIPFYGKPNGGFVLHIPDNANNAKHPITLKYISLLEYIDSIKHEISNFSVVSMGPIHESIAHLFENYKIYDMYTRAGNLNKEFNLKSELYGYPFNIIDHGSGNVTCNCQEKLYHNVLLPNGDVSLCCMDYGLENILGNLYSQNYNDILPENNKAFALCRYCENGININ